MAENLVDGEFWLPAQFLADEEVFDAPFDPKDATLKGSNGNESSLFPSEFPYGFASSSSDHSSPVESLGGGSSETDSDEEEQIIAEIRRQIISRSSHQTDLKSANNTVGRSASGSPQSTLCAFGSGCGCRQGSSQGSPNGACEHSSARATWDLLHAAAGEVERMRLSQEGYIFGHHNQYSGLFSPRRKSSFFTEPSKNNNSKTNPDARFHTHQSLPQQQLQIAQMLRQNQMPKQPNSVWGVQNNSGGVYQQRQNNPMARNRGRNNDVTGGDARTIRPLGLSQSAWPSLQHARQQQQNQQYGSGMRAVFLGNPSGRRERAGTGVFLPRRVDTPAETRRQACSTVLVPTRVAHALNLNLENRVGGQPQPLHRFNASSNLGNAAVPRPRGNYVPSQQRRNIRPQPAAVNNTEIRLPREWTY